MDLTISNLYSAENVLEKINSPSFLEKADFFSRMKFNELQTSRFAKNLDLYVCHISDKEIDYFYEGWKFAEEFLKSFEIKKKFLNPLTLKVTETFRIFKSSINSQEFIEVTQAGNYNIPLNLYHILSTNPNYSTQKKSQINYTLGRAYYDNYKENHLNSELIKAIFHLSKAAQENHQSAQYLLAQCFKAKNEVEDFLYWLLLSWKSKDGLFPVDGLLDLALECEGTHLDAISLLFYEQAAFQGSPYAIVKIIQYYSEGVIAPKNLEYAQLWRKQLPLIFGEDIDTLLEKFSTDPGETIPLKLPESLSLRKEKLVLPTEKTIKKLIRICSYFEEMKRISPSVIC